MPSIHPAPGAQHGPPTYQPGPTNSWLNRDTTMGCPATGCHRLATSGATAAESTGHLSRLTRHAAGPRKLPQNGECCTSSTKPYEARYRQPAGTQVHLGWAVEQVMLSNGYIPATPQEALLQAYLGDQGASTAATLADHSAATKRGPVTGQQLHVQHQQHQQSARRCGPKHISKSKV